MEGVEDIKELIEKIRELEVEKERAWRRQNRFGSLKEVNKVQKYLMDARGQLLDRLLGSGWRGEEDWVAFIDQLIRKAEVKEKDRICKSRQMKQE